MKLLSLRANKPSFHPIVFKDGINIIVGKQVAPLDENDGNTYNGVGKSLTLHLIHFCLGANKITSFAQKLPDWEFTLTLAPAIEKSAYEPKTPEADSSVDADTTNDATAFLETFFKLYPTATEKELAYYVAGNVLEPIGRDYLYSELINPIFTKDGDNVKVKVAVKFLDNQTKATQVSQYELTLHKDSNWKIV